MTRVPTPARRYGPFEEFSTDMERLFDSVLGRSFGAMLRNGNGSEHGNGEKYVPTLDIAETEGHFEVTVDLPGIKPEM